MGCDTKGVIVTPCKDVLLVCAMAQQALDQFIIAERDIRYPDKKDRFASHVNKEFSTVSIHLTPDVGMASLAFVFAGQERKLSLFFTCDCDHKELADKSLSMSMGCWGNSDQLMKTVLHALSLLGSAWFDHNDCDDIDLAPLGEYRPSLMQAVNLKYVRNVRIEECYESLRLLLPDQSLVARERLVGLKGKNFKEFEQALVDKDYSAGWAKLEVLAKKVTTPAPLFVSEYHQEMAETPAEEATPE